MSPFDLRTFADWTVKPRMLAVPGVAGVSVFGGEVRQLQIQIRPDRLAVYSFAYVPWLKGHMKQIPRDTLPAPALKLELLALAIDTLTAAGYRQIGMDHFALPDDEAEEFGEEEDEFYGDDDEDLEDDDELDDEDELDEEDLEEFEDFEEDEER